MADETNDLAGDVSIHEHDHQDGTGRNSDGTEAGVGVTAKAAETRTKAVAPGQAGQEEHLEMGAVGLMTTKEVGAAVKTSYERWRDGQWRHRDDCSGWL